MNSIQKYVLNSLFVRNQITEEKLAQALDTFSNEPAIDAFLSVLITGEETKKDVLLTITGTATRKLQAIKVLKDLFGTGLKETKDLVDMYTDDKLSVTRIPMKKLYTEELDKETMENIERQLKSVSNKVLQQFPYHKHSLIVAIGFINMSNKSSQFAYEANVFKLFKSINQ